MAIKHSTTKASGEKGYASEWNADHVIETGTGICQEATVIVASSTSKNKNIADYQCDGVDDQVEIQEAIDEVTATGGKVILLEGLFRISSPIKLKKGVILEGVGCGPKDEKGTIITNTTDMRTSITATSIKNAIIKNITWKPYDPETESNVGTCISLESCQNIIIEKCHMCSLDCILSLSNCENVIFKENRLYGGLGEWFSKAVNVNDSKVISIRKNYMYGGDEYSIYVTGTSQWIDIEGNYFGEVYGIVTISSTASDCIVRNNFGVDEASRITVGGDRVSIIGNVIYSNHTYEGIKIESTADRCVVVGNIVRNTTANYTNNGTNTQATGNNF